MYRSNWKFDYTAQALAEAAVRQIAFHVERLQFWEAQRLETMTAIRADGIEINEKVALGFTNPKARDWDRGADIMIRNDLRKALLESHEKLAYHTERRDTYDGWRQMLEANRESRLALDIDDWLFFFGRDTGRDS